MVEMGLRLVQLTILLLQTEVAPALTTIINPAIILMA